MSSLNDIMGVAFKFETFNTARAARGDEAAQLMVTIDGVQHPLWMGLSEIEENIELYGKHPDLIKARNAYGG